MLCYKQFFIIIAIKKHIINDFTSKTHEVYNEYIKNRVLASDGYALELKRKYAMIVLDLDTIMLYVTLIKYSFACLDKNTKKLGGLR